MESCLRLGRVSRVWEGAASREGLRLEANQSCRRRGQTRRAPQVHPSVGPSHSHRWIADSLHR